MKYNLSQIFVAEIVGTAMLVFFGDGGVANALLPNTKGHGIGFLGIAICFGMGVYLPLQILGHISALFNPAVAIAVGISGELAWAEVGVALAGETIGAFLGALLVWATYFKHFQRLEAVLPLRPGDDPETAVRVPRDSEGCLDHDALGLKGLHIHQELHPTASRYASAGNLRKRQRVVVRPEDAMHPAKKLLKAVGVNVSDKMHNMEEKMRCFVPTIPSYRVLPSAQDESLAARVAEDQETKLVVFCTRPAEPSHYFICAFWAEFLGTFILTYVALAIGEQRKVFLGGPQLGGELYRAGMEPALIGAMVTGLVLSLGGVTGPALNPARDLMPRIAHAILPIPGKGSSEWWYSWVPVVAPILGAIVGAQFNLAMKKVLTGGVNHP